MEKEEGEEEPQIEEKSKKPPKINKKKKNKIPKTPVMKRIPGTESGTVLKLSINEEEWPDSNEPIGANVLYKQGKIIISRLDLTDMVNTSSHFSGIKKQHAEVICRVMSTIDPNRDIGLLEHRSVNPEVECISKPNIIFVGPATDMEKTNHVVKISICDNINRTEIFNNLELKVFETYQKQHPHLFVPITHWAYWGKYQYMFFPYAGEILSDALCSHDKRAILEIILQSFIGIYLQHICGYNNELHEGNVCVKDCGIILEFIYLFNCMLFILNSIID